MKKFLIFILGLVIGAAAVYFLSPCTLKSQKEATGYVEAIDSLKQEGENRQKPNTLNPIRSSIFEINVWRENVCGAEKSKKLKVF